jgi:hypothetical protein
MGDVEDCSAVERRLQGKRAPWEEHGTNDRLHEAVLLSYYRSRLLGGLGMRVLRRNMCVWHV